MLVHQGLSSSISIYKNSLDARELFVAGSLVYEMHVPDATLSANKTRLIAKLVLRLKGQNVLAIMI